ncbi:MAG TPA: hypothetical protein VM534_07470 [Thermoanaerobaculia bacterium]|nr:hypothetical protein [Thermoanaerobaculia bacterium]
MNGDEVLDVLKEIRDEARLTNGRLESMDGRLESMEGRFEFLEKRVTRGFEELGGRIDQHAEKIELLGRNQIEAEFRLASEVLSLADVTRDVRDLISRKLDDHHLVVNHEERIRTLEDQIADRPPRGE